MVKAYDELPWILRLIVVIAFGAIVGGIYRIVLFLENKNTKTLSTMRLTHLFLKMLFAGFTHWEGINNEIF